MVKYASYHICIICVFMNINDNAKNKEKSLLKFDVLCIGSFGKHVVSKH